MKILKQTIFWLKLDPDEVDDGDCCEEQKPELMVYKLKSRRRVEFPGLLLLKNIIGY